MEKSKPFSDYLFMKMGPANTANGVNCAASGVASGVNELSLKTTERCEALPELKGYRKWIRDNLMLLVTLSGVLLGICLGKTITPSPLLLAIV